MGVTLLTRQLRELWPSGGPLWDALGRAASGQLVLVQAKAHIPELLSPPTQPGHISGQVIRESLQEAARALGAPPRLDLSRRIYQYANCLAHGWFLTHANGLPVCLGFVNLIGDADMRGLSSRQEWEAALTVLHEALGLRGWVPKFVVAAAVKAGGVIAVPPMKIPGHGTLAISLQGGTDHGLWQK